MTSILWEWLSMAVRWLHVIAGIAWIGSSFYFVHLDSSLKTRAGLPEGAGGEAWQVHGGGFYHMVKYLVAPAQMPDELTWFKWEAYATWLSGMGLLVIVYYFGAQLYLIDTSVLALPVWGAVLISVAGLALGWVVYDQLCKSKLGDNDTLLFAVLFGGAMAGLGGAYLSLVQTPLWVERMTAGRGWIALALVAAPLAWLAAKAGADEPSGG